VALLLVKFTRHADLWAIAKRLAFASSDEAAAFLHLALAAGRSAPGTACAV
jgi:hypothetical protein